jgi:RNA polymerase sigma factor (TIGR02999 family)
MEHRGVRPAAGIGPEKDHAQCAMLDIHRVNGEDGSVSEVTRILRSIQAGTAQCADELLPLVYAELRKLAAHKMAHEPPGHTLQPTALVHEAWLRLLRGENTDWNGRSHFFGAAAEAMRRILVERARRKQALRYGGGLLRLDVQEIEIAAPAKEEDLLALSDALEQFTRRDPKKAELVKLRYFVGLTTEEAAEVLGISVPTADRWWRYSRAWLSQEIERQQNCLQA